METLNVYIIGDPNYKINLSTQIEALLRERDYVLTFDINFFSYSTEEDYDRFISEAGNISGLVILYDELYSSEQLEKILKAQGVENPSHDQILDEWLKRQGRDMACLYEVLLPLIGRGQVYLALWNDVTTMGSSLRDLFARHLKLNGWPADNLCPFVLNVYGGDYLNNVAFYMRSNPGLVRIFKLAHSNVETPSGMPLEKPKEKVIVPLWSEEPILDMYS